MDGDILIQCPKCRRSARVPRCDTDPFRATMAEILCPECVGGDFGETAHFDASGNQILPGPTSNP